MSQKVRSTHALLIGLSLLVASCGSVAPQRNSHTEVTAQDWGTTPPPGSKGGPTNNNGVILSPASTARLRGA